MPTIDVPATEPDRLHNLIEAAIAAPRTRLTQAQRDRLNYELRAELRRLIPRVQQQADRINRGTRAWYSRDKALGEARALLRTGLSPSALAASLHLGTLARAVHALDQFAGGEA